MDPIQQFTGSGLPVARKAEISDALGLLIASSSAVVKEFDEHFDHIQPELAAAIEHLRTLLNECIFNEDRPPG